MKKTFAEEEILHDGKKHLRVNKVKNCKFWNCNLDFLKNTYFKVNYLLSLSINYWLNNIFELWHLRSSCPKTKFFEHSNFELCISKHKSLQFLKFQKIRFRKCILEEVTNAREFLARNAKLSTHLKTRDPIL